MLARFLLQGGVVLLNELILIGARLHHLVARDDKEGVLPASGTSAVVLLRSPRVSGSPLTNTLKTEDVITVA